MIPVSDTKHTHTRLHNRQRPKHSDSPPDTLDTPIYAENNLTGARTQSHNITDSQTGNNVRGLRWFSSENQEKKLSEIYIARPGRKNAQFTVDMMLPTPTTGNRYLGKREETDASPHSDSPRVPVFLPFLPASLVPFAFGGTPAKPYYGGTTSMDPCVSNTPHDILPKIYTVYPCCFTRGRPSKHSARGSPIAK